MTATVTTTRPIDLGQLAAEVGSPLTMSDDGTERTVSALDETTTQAALQAAVDAHTPVEIPSAATLMQAQLDELTDLTFELLNLLEGS